MLIIGCGNEDRSDDGAGLMAVRRLRAMGFEAKAHSGEALELMEAWAGAEEVVVIDAVVSGRAPGTLLSWNAVANPLPRAQFQCSTHAWGLAEAVELARALGRLPDKLIIYGIEAGSLAAGGTLTPQVSRTVEEVATRIAQEAACTNPH